MIFQSKWTEHAVIVRATTRVAHPGGFVDLKPGLRAHFSGENRLFDSVQTQENNDWSDEEREQVEKALLKNKDFGQGIYLAAGQVLPKEYESLVKANPKANVTSRCAFIQFLDGNVDQCSEATVPGGTHCEAHRTDRVNINRPAIGKPADHEGKAAEGAKA